MDTKYMNNLLHDIVDGTTKTRVLHISIWVINLGLTQSPCFSSAFCTCSLLAILVEISAATRSIAIRDILL